MSLAAGTRLGPYEVVSPIGEGGMGEVYRARDTKLDREVAIKVLPEEFAKDDERLARFEREAKLLASLNHPNIASIYGLEESDGVKALVLELVEGPTLAERIQEGPMPVEETLAISRQIAEALEAGHEAGVIHRDLKPANIKLKEDGTVKVLDYGLAKALQGDTPGGADSELSQSPTLTRHGTQVGVILGTAAYMSPEQAKGKRVDKRADVWAFGAVLFEMLTGRQAFTGDDVSDVMASVLKTEPDWQRLPAGLHPRIQELLRRCLEKDRSRRRRDIGDVRVEIGDFMATTMVTAEAASADPRKWLAIVAGAVVITAAATWSLKRLPAPIPNGPIRFEVLLPPTQSSSFRRMLALSSDGKRLVYEASNQLYLRALDQTEATPLRGTEGGADPFFSPDGRWLGFFVNRALKKLSLDGGAVVTLYDDLESSPDGASWSKDGTIALGQGRAGIMKVSEDGGVTEVLVAPDPDRRFLYHGPRFLPGGDAILFSQSASMFRRDEGLIVAQSLQTGERQIVWEGGTDGRYLSTGHLIYVRENTLFAVGFDPGRLSVEGSPVPVVEAVRMDSSGTSLSVSESGTLVHVPLGTDAAERLVWVDRNGETSPLVDEPGDYQSPRFSPDGKRLAFGRGADAWIYELELEIASRLTTQGAVSTHWSPDGVWIAFSSGPDGDQDLYRKRSDFTGEAERLLDMPGEQWVRGFTPDGGHLLYSDTGGATEADIGMLPLEGEREPRTVLGSEFYEGQPTVSPDGEWIAYCSDESGRREIYVQPFPGLGRRRRLSRDGGGHPLWSPRGDEIFFIQGNRLMAAKVRTAPDFESAPPTELLVSDRLVWADIVREYDITPDGERFVVVEREESEIDAERILVTLNWFEELERLVPTDN